MVENQNLVVLAASAVLEKDVHTHDGKETDANSTTKKDKATNIEEGNRPCNKSNASCENRVEHPCSSEGLSASFELHIRLRDGGA